MENKMNKYKEALNSIRFTMHYRVKPMKLGRCEDQNLHILEELVEKATPKKPTEADASEENSYCAWLCPTCGRTHINNYPLNYCNDCGQKIDWSDYEKYIREGEQERN